jgi:hypothetical protein
MVDSKGKWWQGGRPATTPSFNPSIRSFFLSTRFPEMDTT